MFVKDSNIYCTLVTKLFILNKFMRCRGKPIKEAERTRRRTHYPQSTAAKTFSAINALGKERKGYTVSVLINSKD